MFDGVMARESKVPRITLAFWLTKIVATTLGETGGDAVSMTLRLGYALSSLLFLGLLLAALAAQFRARIYRPFVYWTVIVATTTAGTTMADFADRSLGIGYVGGSLVLAALLAAVLALWHYSAGSVSVNVIAGPKTEAFYWVTILFSNTLGTALGDFLADGGGLGYERGAMVFAMALLVVGALHAWTGLSRTWLFWAAFILTRPLGATIGDLLTKAHAHGGLELGRVISSLVLAGFMLMFLWLRPQQAGSHPGLHEGR